jgi:hypothetical protein
MSAFKCILSLLWLALFAEQSSYKFYQLASTPQNHSRKVGTNETCPGSDHIFSNCPNHTGMSLSLDKRYNLKHIFTLPAPLQRIDALPTEHKNKCFFFYSEATICSSCLTTALRGPPVV